MSVTLAGVFVVKVAAGWLISVSAPDSRTSVFKLYVYIKIEHFSDLQELL